MKLLSNVTNTVLTKFDDRQLVSVVGEVHGILKNFWYLLDFLNGEDEDNDPYVQLDEIEAVFSETTYEDFKLFTKYLCGQSDPIQRRANGALHYLDQAYAMMGQASGPYIPLEPKQVAMLRESVENTLAELAYFLFYQFSMDVTQASIADGKETEVNVALHSYADENGEDVKEMLIFVTEVMSKFRPSLTIFEEYPDLEEAFYEIAGAYIRDFDRLSEFLTADIVSGVINGTVDVEKTIKDFEEKLNIGDDNG